MYFGSNVVILSTNNKKYHIIPIMKIFQNVARKTAVFAMAGLACSLTAGAETRIEWRLVRSIDDIVNSSLTQISKDSHVVLVSANGPYALSRNNYSDRGVAAVEVELNEDKSQVINPSEEAIFIVRLDENRNNLISVDLMNGFVPLVKSPIKRQTLRFSMMFDYTHRDNSRFNRYTVNFRLNPNPVNQSYQYFDGSPDNDKKYDFSLTYAKYFTTSTHLDIEYKFEGLYERRSSLLYLLDKVNGFDAEGSLIGTLPSWHEYAPTIDAGQSYESRLQEYQNAVTPKFITAATLSDNSALTIDISVPVKVLSRSYDYLLTAQRTPLSGLYITPLANWSNCWEKLSRAV